MKTMMSNIKELKELIKNLPDDMRVVVAKDDTPDYQFLSQAEVVDAIPYNDYGFGVAFRDSNPKKTNKVFLLN